MSWQWPTAMRLKTTHLRAPVGHALPQRKAESPAPFCIKSDHGGKILPAPKYGAQSDLFARSLQTPGAVQTNPTLPPCPNRCPHYCGKEQDEKPVAPWLCLWEVKVRVAASGLIMGAQPGWGRMGGRRVVAPNGMFCCLGALPTVLVRLCKLSPCTNKGTQGNTAVPGPPCW